MRTFSETAAVRPKAASTDDCSAPRWTAPLHIVGAWLTADLLSEAARDLNRRKPRRWGGREYIRHEKA